MIKADNEEKHNADKADDDNKEIKITQLTSQPVTAIKADNEEKHEADDKTYFDLRKQDFYLRRNLAIKFSSYNMGIRPEADIEVIDIENIEVPLLNHFSSLHPIHQTPGLETLAADKKHYRFSEVVRLRIY